MISAVASRIFSRVPVSRLPTRFGVANCPVLFC